MAQLSLYLDDDTMERLRLRAEERHTSLSKYVSDLVRRDLTSGWPPGFFDLYGSIDDEAFDVPGEVPWELDAPRPWDDASWKGLLSDDGEGQPADERLDGRSAGDGEDA